MRVVIMDAAAFAKVSISFRSFSVRSANSSNFEATVVEYEYGTANPAAKAQGIKLKYVGDKNYTAGKTFTLQLTFAATSDNDSKDMTLDGEVATEDAVVEGVSVLVK